MKKLLSILSVFALVTGAATSVGFLSTTANNQPTNVVTLENNLSNLDLSQFYENGDIHSWIGTKEEAKAMLDELLTEFKKWNPDLAEGKEYNIFYGLNGSWTLIAVEGADIEFEDYNFYVIIDLSELETLTINIDDPNTTRSDIEARVADLISGIAEGAELNVDYFIPIIYNPDGYLDKVGLYSVVASEYSNILAGNFYIRVTKTIDTSEYQTTGSKLTGQMVLNKIILEIRRWNPDAVEGIDYEIVRTENGSWTINSNSDSLVNVNFEFNVVNDISEIKEINFYINNVDTTIEAIKARVANEIAKIAPDAVLGVDYIIQDIPTDINGRPIKVGRYKVRAIEGSKILVGQFNLRLAIQITA